MRRTGKDDGKDREGNVMDREGNVKDRKGG